MTFTAMLKHETESARLFLFKDGRELWVPRSVCKSVLKYPGPDGVTSQMAEVEVEDWWGRKAGL